MVPALDRLGRSCKASSRSSPVCKRGIGFRSLDEALDTPPGGRLVSVCSPRWA
ncbi:hypothetical protein [Nocardia sp. NPDC050412]|uniref:hypothetical protein n=1 Tax=Nocardia sp. NPDC050412 TaxID=3364320 RepID=UPI00378D499E